MILSAMNSKHDQIFIFKNVM